MKMICSKMIQHSTQKENLFTRIIFFSYHLRASQFSLSFCFCREKRWIQAAKNSSFDLTRLPGVI